jgi:hypothetical protein
MLGWNWVARQQWFRFNCLIDSSIITFLYFIYFLSCWFGYPSCSCRDLFFFLTFSSRLVISFASSTSSWLTATRGPHVCETGWKLTRWSSTRKCLWTGGARARFRGYTTFPSNSVCHQALFGISVGVFIVLFSFFLRSFAFVVFFSAVTSMS